MVEERTHGNFFDQVRYTANVVGMVVGQQEKVDLAHTCVFRRGGDTAGIKSVACPTGVDQQRLPCRGHK